MLLTAMAITAACQNIDVWANHQDACQKFFEVSSQKIGVTETDQKTENYYTLKAKTVAADNLGTTVIDVAGGVGYVYRVYRNKAIDFKLPNLGICDTVSNHITPNSYTLNLKWNFPWLK